MIELVLWSFVMALTPLALGLLWRLVTGAIASFDASSTRRTRSPGKQAHVQSLSCSLSSSSITLSGFRPFAAAARPWLSHQGKVPEPAIPAQPLGAMREGREVNRFEVADGGYLLACVAVKLIRALIQTGSGCAANRGTKLRVRSWAAGSLVPVGYLP